jgi:hypothetical protein
MVKPETMRRVAIAALAALLVGGGVIVASAASLGGVRSDQFGADAAVVAACDSDGVDVEYTNTYDADAQEYIVEAVLVKDVALGCTNLELKLTLIDAADVSLWIGTATVLGGTVTLDVPTASAIGSADIHKVAILIAG